MEVFRDYAYYYNTFYRDKDYSKEAGEVDYLLKKYGSKIQRVINFGCGTGKHDLELEKKGFQCCGIDISELMIQIAKKNADAFHSKINFSVADIRSYESKEKFDAVISLFHVMSYQNSNDDIQNAFCSARKCLEKGGLFLFDAWYGPGVLTDRPLVRVKEVEDEKNKMVRIARPCMHDNTNIVDVCYEVFIIDKKTNITKTIKETHSMRYFFRPEIQHLLENARFKLIDCIDCKSLANTNYDTWTNYYIARAI